MTSANAIMIALAFLTLLVALADLYFSYLDYLAVQVKTK